MHISLSAYISLQWPIHYFWITVYLFLCVLVKCPGNNCHPLYPMCNVLCVGVVFVHLTREQVETLHS